MMNWNDKDEVLAAVTENGDAPLEYASKELKADREVILAAVQQWGVKLYWASKELKADREVVLAAVQQSGLALQYASEELNANHAVVLAAVQQNGHALRWASEELKAEHAVVLAAVRQKGDALGWASEELRADREILFAAVRQNGHALRYASKRFPDRYEVVLAAIKQNGYALQYASEELKSNREFVLAAVRQNGIALEYASKELKADHAVVLAAVQQNGDALKYASKKLKADHVVVLAAVKQNGDALGWASEELKADHAVVLAAVQQNGDALKYASKKLKADREVVLTAIKQKGDALGWAPEELKADREFVLAAVQQNGIALKYASKKLKADREVVLTAVQQDGLVFEYIAIRPIYWYDLLGLVTKALHKNKDGREILHKWVNDDKMAEKLKYLVKHDNSIADIEDNKNGKTAINNAHPACREKMKESLRLFGKYEVADGAWEHLSPTACVFKVKYFGKGNENVEPVSMVLKCMSNFAEVEAELKCRKQLKWGCKNVMLIENVHVDSSLKSKYDDIKKLGLEETEICLVKGLEHSIRNRVKDKENLIKRENSASKEEKDYTYKYVLALQFADRTLNRAIKDDEIAGTNLAKHILEDIGNGILEVHETGRIHGDIKPPNLLRVGTAWKLADLDISCQIGEKYGKKIPSTGWCPPEVVKAIGKEQLQYLEASIAHDLWSFGTLIYYLETGTELFQVDNRDKLAETNEIIYWHKDSQQRKKLKKIKEKQEAYRLLEKLLEFDPEKRLQNFSKNGKQEAMTIVLEDGYFSQHNNRCNKIDILIDIVDEMGEQLDKISSQIIRIENLTRAQQVELKQTSKVLLHAIYEATEVQTPTTFVILDEVLPEEPEKLLALDVADGYETLADDVIVQLNKWDGQKNQAKTWIKRLSSNELMQDMNPESIAAFIKGAATELVTKKTMYFYWVDELTAQPVRAPGFPIKITKPADIVPKLLPYIQVGMCAMSIYCGSAGIAKMFGFPIPTVPKEFRIGLKESVETLKQKSSVEAFQCVHEKVEAKDGETETLRGAGLRELEAFMKEHMSHLDDDSKFAGLNRIADSDGTAIWTVKTKEEVPHALEQRTKQRKYEAALVAIDLKEEQQELKELRQRNKKLEAFMKEHMSHLDDDSKFAGLNRIADSDGTAIWTVKTKEEVPHALEQRTKQRKQEGALVAIDLKEDQQELKELRQRNHELEQKAQTTCCVIC